MLLDVKNIDVLYDDFQVIWDVSINVNKAEMVALLGPNGSGKSTVLNTISNLVEHRNGTINFEDNLISNIPTYKRTELGISHVLERRRVFPHLTVKQNLLLGAWHPKAKDELFNSLEKIYKIFPKLETRSNQLAKTISYVSQDRENLQGFTVYEYAEMGRFPYQNFIGLYDDASKEIIDDSLKTVNMYNRKDEYVNNLSGGEMQILRIARSLAQDVNLIMFDEPTSCLLYTSDAADE